MYFRHCNPSELVKIVSICALSIFLLFSGFFSNYWQVAHPRWFHNFQRDTESMIVGRMVKSWQDGIFSDGGLTGKGSLNAIPSRNIDRYNNQYRAYTNGIKFGTYSTYKSQIGGQGMLFSLLDSLIPLSPKTKLNLFHMITSLLTAVALTFIVLWFYLECGLSIAISVLVSSVLSQWLVVFGRNLWWGLWAFYLPMIVVMYFLRNDRTPTRRHAITFGILVFFSVFVKCLVNGYEYITTTLVMMMTPFIYYSILDRLNISKYVNGILVAISCSVLAILLSFMILFVQIASVTGSMQSGVDHIVSALERRTHGDVDDLPARYADILKARTTIHVVGTYVKGTFFDVNNYVYTSNWFVSRKLFDVTYLKLIVFFLMMSVFVFFHRNEYVSAKERQSSIALILGTWFSILAPLSWFVIFKGHSLVHPHMNFIVWQMPFTLFGFAVCGLAARTIFSDLVRLTQGRVWSRYLSPMRSRISSS